MAKVFLIDDDVDLISQNKMVFEEHGHEVIVAHTGKEALKMLDKISPDVLVVDVMMEDHVAGFKFAREAYKKMNNVPLIILSGDPNKPNWMLQPNETWNAVTKQLDKPVKPEKLVKIVEEILKK